MPELKLHYFDFNGGRGEVARLAMWMGRVDFEDHRIPVAEWPAHREAMPFKALPVLEVDGEMVTQSNAINRYVGKLSGLYPDDRREALRCDEVMDAVEDVLTQVVFTFGMTDPEEKQAARHALATGPIPLYLARLDTMLLARGGEHFADDRLTVADLKVAIWIDSLRSGNLDHIPVDLPDHLAPQLVDLRDRVHAHPAIVAYYEKH